MKTKLRIISLFADRKDSEYTILQVAKAVEKSYAHVNKECRELIHSGILSKKVVGNAILCKLSMKNESLIGYLALISSLKSFSAIKENPKLQELIDEAQSNKDIISIFKEKDSVFIVSNSDKISFGKNFKKISKLSLSEFSCKIDFSNITIVYGYETLWRSVYG